MELETKLTQNGQEIQTGDVNTIGESGALADDRVLAELLRLAPNTGTMAKCILPYGVNADTNGTVSGSGLADGNVTIRPFRAVIGSRDTASTDAMHAWRDIRSGVCVAGKDVTASAPPTSLTTTQAIAANSSGHARWDVIYATVTPDTGANSVQRAVKLSTSGIVTTPTLATLYACKVSLGYTQGTPASSPALPSVPVDASGVYYIALAYVMVPNGFTSSTQVQSWMILDAVPAPIALSKGLGGSNAAPANQQNAIGGQVVSSSTIASWANNSTSSTSARPYAFMPPTMAGSEVIWVCLDLSGSGSGWSHQNGDLIDSSRDWRNRVFRSTWQAGYPVASGGMPAWARVWGPGQQTPLYSYGSYTTMGQSFVDDYSGAVGSSTNGAVAQVTNTQLSHVAGSGAAVGIYCDTSGALRLYASTSPSPNCVLVVWLEASRPYVNY